MNSLTWKKRFGFRKNGSTDATFDYLYTINLTHQEHILFSLTISLYLVGALHNLSASGHKMGWFRVVTATPRTKGW